MSPEHNWHPEYDEEQGRIIESCFDCGVSRECYPESGLNEFRGLKAKLSAREKRMREVAEEMIRLAVWGIREESVSRELKGLAAKLLEGLDA